MNSVALLVSTLREPEARARGWAEFITREKLREAAEIGVFRGQFAEAVLQQCPEVSRYLLVDPWRNLSNWNKPANQTDEIFEQFRAEALARTAFAADRRIELRGTTREVIARVPDASLDFIYIDGDHTLRGIVVDLLRWWPKLREGAWMAGDDLSPTIWQHADKWEPTLVFPFAVHFAEGMDVPIHALPGNQFLIQKHPSQGFALHDHTHGCYADTSLRSQLLASRSASSPTSQK